MKISQKILISFLIAFFILILLKVFNVAGILWGNNLTCSGILIMGSGGSPWGALSLFPHCFNDNSYSLLNLLTEYLIAMTIPFIITYFTLSKFKRR